MLPMSLVKVEMSAYLKTNLKVQTMVSNGNEGDRREILFGKNAYAIHINCTKKKFRYILQATGAG
jgi:hypothetical protein